MTTDLRSSEFQLMTKIFNKLIELNPSAESIKKELLDLKSEAEKSSELNIRQKDAIIAKCDNYLNGNYGNTKTKENLTYQS